MKETVYLLIRAAEFLSFIWGQQRGEYHVGSGNFETIQDKA